MSRAYSCRPSELLDIEDTHDAYRLDRAVWHFGTSLKAALDAVKGKTDKEIERKQDRVMRKWIPEMAASPRQFRDPKKEITRHGNQL